MTRDELVEKVARETAAALLENIDSCECSDCVEQASGHIVRAIRLVIEECARVAEVYIIEQNSIHPDVPFERLSDQAKTIAHTTCQHVALSIRSLLPEESST